MDDKNLMKFNRGKWYLGQTNTLQGTVVGSSSEKGLGKLKAAVKANSTLGYVRSSTARRWGKQMIIIPYSQSDTSGILCFSTIT